MESESGSMFTEISDEEKQAEKIKLNADKTLKVNKGSAKIFKDYLIEKGESEDFEQFDNMKLDKLLGLFYMDLRQADGSHYKVNSLETIRHGISRHLKCPPFNRKVDIVKDSAFADSNSSFKSVVAEMKKSGKGDVDHHPMISESDLKILYCSKHLSTSTPRGLSNKVQFDIRMFFCRRGNENMHAMTKNTFKVFTDEKTGRKFIKKAVDELTKNDPIDKKNSSRVMPEVKGSIYCPVLSFETYLSKLHPSCEKLWQRPKDIFSNFETVWFCNIAIGEKKLSTFLSTLSRVANLSKVYTNQSINATGPSILSKCMFKPPQVMPVARLKYIQSLGVYQCVSDQEKLQMGESLGENLILASSLPVLPSTQL